MKKFIALAVLIAAASFLIGAAQLPQGGVTRAGGGGGGAITFGQAATANITTGSTTFSVGAAGTGTASNWTLAVGSGDWLFVDFVAFNPSTLSATDSLSTALTCGFSPAENSFYEGYCYGKSTASGTDTINLTAGLAISPTVVALDFSGLTGAVDGTISSSNFNAIASATAWTLPGLTTTNAADLIIGCAGTNSVNETYTQGTGYTIPTRGQASGGNQSAFCEYQIVSSAATYTPAATAGTATTAIGGTFAFK